MSWLAAWIVAGACGGDAGGAGGGSATDAGSSTGSVDRTTSGASASSPDGSGTASGDGSGPATDTDATGGMIDEDLERYAQFLHYYSPIILKQAAEEDGDGGRDWLTNFDFDRDGGELSNNRANWLEERPSHVDGSAHADWEIRPTLYSAALQFDDAGITSMILLYHVYHAEQGNVELEDIVPEYGSIHDWERIELRIDDVGSSPGQDESVRYMVVTEHGTHQARSGDTVEFHETKSGAHPLLWQAEHANPLGVGFAELHFVEETALSVLASDTGRVAVNGESDQSFHYAFVDPSDAEAAAAWGVLTLTADNAAQLVASTDDPPAMSSVRRIAYELQDLADVFPSHLDTNAGTSWADPTVDILLDEPMLDEQGNVTVPAGMQVFHSGSVDDLDSDEDRKGYPRKHWFWGAYLFDDESVYGEAFDGEPMGSRCIANGHPDCADNFWAQHDYFAHEGIEGDGSFANEAGAWLPSGWHAQSAGGFDGRWVSLFAD